MDKATRFGRYWLESKLGAGAMGEVYRAFDTDTDRVVAVKVLVPHLAEDEKFQARFRQEARTAAGLNDPHVVPIHNFGEIDGRLYVDMRLIEGRDLGTVLASGPMPPEQAVTVVEQIASALDAAHQAGLVHRDVKPSNILVTERNFAYLIDFGIARGAESSGMTSAGHTMGTLAYMAPERFQTGNADPRSDIYALACVLHECLTGRRPFDAESLEQQIAAHMMAPPPRPSVLQLSVPAALDNVIAKGMAKNPVQRYRTAPELGAAARAALSGARQDMSAPRQPVPPSQPRQPTAPVPSRPANYSHPRPPQPPTQQQPVQPPRPQVAPQPQPQQPQPMGNYTPSSFGAVAPQHQPQHQPQQPPAGKSRAPMIATLVTVGAIALIALLVTGFVAPGFFVTNQLDLTAAQTDVQRVLEDKDAGYGATGVSDVTCNDGKAPEIKTGATFDCDVTIDGSPYVVTVTFTDDKGAYEVGRPTAP